MIRQTKYIHNHWKLLIKKEITWQMHDIVNFETKIPLRYACCTTFKIVDSSYKKLKNDRDQFSNIHLPLKIHLPLNKMAAIPQATFSNTISWM